MQHRHEWNVCIQGRNHFVYGETLLAPVFNRWLERLEIAAPFTQQLAMKVKPANHLFRVGTDDDRTQYRNERRQELRAFVEPRLRLASAIAGGAMFSMSRDDGYAVCASGSVAGTEDLVAFARDQVERVDLVARKADANKPFMIKLLDMKGMTLESPLLRFALRRDIVATAASYLGVVPILQYANVMYSSQAGGEFSKSQLYHCDSDESEQVKIFVLCEPVTPSEGPFDVRAGVAVAAGSRTCEPTDTSSGSATSKCRSHPPSHFEKWR